MGRNKFYDDLYVYMNDHLVGHLGRLSTGEMTFQYETDWLEWDRTRPISLSMPLTTIPYKGNAVINYFDNLLPDNVTIRNRVQTRFRTKTDHCYDLLSEIGIDCVGALQIVRLPLSDIPNKIHATELTKDQIGSRLKQYRTAPLGMDSESDFRISIAGVQEKTALLRYKNQWHLPSNTTPTTHIIKLPIGKIAHSGIDLSESVENEWLCLQILKEFGLPVNQAEIETFADVNTLVVERFDREWTKNGEWIVRLPQEDLCQAFGLPSAFKYESDGGPGIKRIMDLLALAARPDEARINFMKTVFIYWLLAAIDGHAKNFSLSLKAHNAYQPTPLYDVMSAYPIIAQRGLDAHEIKMAMAVTGNSRHYKWMDIQYRHWLSMADKCQFKSMLMEKIIDEIIDTLPQIIERVSQKLPSGFPEKIAESIFSGMGKLKEKCTNGKNANA